MDRFGSDQVVRLMEVVNGERLAGATVGQLIDAAGQPHNRVAYVLSSLLELEARALPPAASEALAAFRQQRARYADLLAQLQRRCAGLYQIKGFHLQALYPPGVLRDSNDLDLVVADPAQMRAAVALLEGSGFAPLVCGVYRTRAGRHAYHVAMARKVGDAGQPGGADYVELANYSLIGSPLVPPSFADLSAVPDQAAVDIIATLRERFEQPYRPRDLLDVALAVERLDDSGVASLPGAVAELRVAPELAELARTLRRCGLPGEAARLPRVPKADVRRELRRRAWRQVRHLASPQALVSTRAEGRRTGRRARLLRRLGGSRVLRVEPVGRLMAAGLRATGLYVDDRRAPDIEVDGDLARTPAGTFRLSTRPVQMMPGFEDAG